MSATATTTSGVLQVVIRHVNSAGNDPAASNTAVSKLEKLRKAHPEALGTVQIMVGVVMLLIGIVMAATAGPWPGLSVLSGVTVWGSMIYIAAGSLAVAADSKLNRCLVNATLGMSVVASTAAGISIILHSFDTFGLFTFGLFTSRGFCFQPSFCTHDEVRSQGIAGVMLVLSLLEFIVSIRISSSACKAACNPEPQQVFYIGSEMLQSSTVAQGGASNPLLDHEVDQNSTVPEEACSLPDVHHKDQPPKYMP